MNKFLRLGVPTCLALSGQVATCIAVTVAASGCDTVALAAHQVGVVYSLFVCDFGDFSDVVARAEINSWN